MYAVDQIVIAEYKYFLPYVLQHLHPLTSSIAVNHLKSADLYDYTQRVIFNLPPDQRTNVYINPNADEVTRHVRSDHQSPREISLTLV